MIKQLLHPFDIVGWTMVRAPSMPGFELMTTLPMLMPRPQVPRHNTQIEN